MLSLLVQDIFVTTQYSNNLLGRAAIAVQAGMKTVPGELISLVPNTQVAIDDLKATAARLKGYNSEKAFKDGYNIVSLPKINALIKKLEKDEDSKEPNEARSLALSGFLWSQSGNSQAAYSAYKVLEERFSRVENREQNLFSLILLAQKIGNTEEADKYSRGFLRAFPNSDKIDEVRKFMLLGLYGNKEYAECIKSGISQLSDLEKSKPSKGHDICTFVLGGSYYYTGNFQDALTMLEGHQKDYPESEYHNDVLFLEASTLSRLQRMGSAIKKYDEYLAATEAEPSALYPYALFEKASSHYAIGENEQASDALGSLERRFRKSPIVDSALSLKGNILQAEDKVEEAEAAYVAAFENAKAKGNKPVAGEALNYLVQSLADSSRKGGSKSKEAVQYYDAFWKDYAKDSPHQALVAVSGFSAMKEVGRSEEGLKKMEEVISKVAKLPGQPQLENLINSYSEAFLEVKSVEELKTHYYNFKGIKSEDKEALALLRIALITAYEKEIKEAKKGKDDNEVKQKVNKLNADIKVLFADLKSDFKPSILTPYSLIKIGDYIREKTDNVSEAIVYYDEIIKRKNKEFEKRAQFGLADLYAQSNKAGDTKKAKEYLAQISNGENSSKREKEKAFFRLVELLIEKEEWAEGNAKASEYLKEKSFKNRENRERAVYYIALSYDKMGKKEDALANYVGVYGASLPFIEISAPSVARMMELYWERNKAAITRGDRKVIPGDRQAAYNHGWGYIDITKRNLKKFTKADRSKWEKVQALVKEYEQSGEIVDMAKQKAAQQR